MPGTFSSFLSCVFVYLNNVHHKNPIPLLLICFFCGIFDVVGDFSWLDVFPLLCAITPFKWIFGSLAFGVWLNFGMVNGASSIFTLTSVGSTSSIRMNVLSAGDFRSFDLPNDRDGDSNSLETEHRLVGDRFRVESILGCFRSKKKKGLARVRD